MRSGRGILGAASLIAAGVVAVAGPGIAAATGGQSHATNFQTASDTVVCGLALVHGTHFDAGTGTEVNGLWPGLQCSAPGIRRAPGSNVGDPFVQLGQGRAGRAQLVDLSQDDLIYNRAPRTLAAGTTWTRDHITCAIHFKSIACSNASGHGFTLRAGRLRRH